MRKKISLFLVLVLVLSFSFSSVFAEGDGNKMMQGQNHNVRETFTDMGGYSWGVNEVEELSLEGKITGYENGEFLPENPVTQLESIAMIVRMMAWENKETSKECKFDLEKIPTWGQNYVDIADELGVFDGIDEFDSNEPATRELIAKYILNAYNHDYGLDCDCDNPQEHLYDYNYLWGGTKYLDDDQISDENKEAVYAMKALGLMIGDQNAYFNPVTSVRRLEMAMVMHRHQNVHRHRNIFNQVTDDVLRASILIDDLYARYNVSIDPEITIKFTENVYYMTPGDEFDVTYAEKFIELTDSDDVDVDFTVVFFDDYWVITPDTLEYHETYHISLDKSKIVDSDGNVLVEQSEAIFTTVHEKDVYVEEITPENDADDVAVETVIEIEFSEVLTANAEDFLDIDYYYEGSWEPMDEEDYTVDVVGNVWTITFDEDLEFNQLYRVDLAKTEILNFVGEDIFEFMTIGKNTVIVEPSGDEEAVDQVIEVTFGDVILDLDEEEFNETSILDVIKIYVNDVEVDVTAVVTNSTETVVELSHGDFLEYSSDYEIMIDENMILDGIANETEYEFSTVDAPEETQ